MKRREERKQMGTREPVSGKGPGVESPVKNFRGVCVKEGQGRQRGLFMAGPTHCPKLDNLSQ